MRYVILGIAMVIVIVGALLIYRHRKKSDTLPDYYIHLCIPYKQQAQVDEEKIMHRFMEKWNIEAGCSENSEWSEPQKKKKVYLLADETNVVRLIVSDVPLPEQLVDVTLKEAWHLNEDEKAALREHRAYILLEYLMGAESAEERVKFAAQALQILLEDENAIAVIDTSSRLYRSRKDLEFFLKDSKLPAAGLFLLFVNTHFVQEEGRLWMHTHGMEQFYVPDVEVYFKEQDRESYYRELLSDAAIYMIHKGPVLKEGHTVELQGDGIIYDIKSVKASEEHPYGAFGAVEIVKK